MAPREFEDGEELPISILTWRSGRTPRQCLGSNGAEVQALTEAEDANFKVRALWLEINGIKISKESLYDQVKLHTSGILIMDSRGIFDASTRKISSLHGLRSSRAGYES